MTALNSVPLPSDESRVGLPRWLALVSLCLLAWYGVGVYLYRFAIDSRLPAWVCVTFAAGGAALLVWSYLIDRPTGRSVPPLLDVIWLAPLAFLPLLPKDPVKHLVALALILFGSGFLNAWRKGLRRSEPATHGSPGGLLWPAGIDQRLDAWTAFLLWVVVFGSLSAIVSAYHTASEVMDNDGYYYLGVARYMAQHHSFREPIVWHFLAPPANVIHPPGDYWGPMTSVLLAIPMAFLGANGNVAALTIAAVACLANVLFWYLVCFALPLRHRITQLLALMLFVFSPRVAAIRVQTESGVFFHAFILLTLIFFCRRKGVLALVCAFCAMLTRGDGIISLAIVGGVLVFQAVQEGPGDHRRRLLRQVLATTLCLAAIYFTWTFTSFGKPYPPATEMTPRLGDYFDVYDWEPTHRKPLTSFAHRFSWSYIAEHGDLFFETFYWAPFFKADSLWLGLAVLAGLVCFQPRRRLNECLVWLLAFPGYYLVVWASGAAFHRWRTPMELLPTFVLAGAIGLDLVLSGFEKLRWPTRRALTLTILAAQTALVAWVAVQALAGLKPYEAQTKEQRLGDENVALADLLGSAAVASDYPWRIIAFTQSPAVSVPMDGAKAIEEVLKKYHVQYLVLFARPAYWWRESKEATAGLWAGPEATIGSLTFERVTFRGGAAIFRVRGTD